MYIIYTLENLTKKISNIFDKIKRSGVIEDSTLQNVMREIRVALLESDVSLSVAKDFIENVKSKAIGQEVIKSISPDQMIIKIVNDQLTELLGSENDSLKLNAKTPVLFLMVGLQGSGKTTTSAKLARWITKNNNKKMVLTWIMMDVHTRVLELDQGAPIEPVTDVSNMCSLSRL